MKKTVLFIFAMILSITFFSVAAGDKERLLQVNCEISGYVGAREAYLLFLLEGKGLSVAQAVNDCSIREKHFLDLLKKNYPRAEVKSISVNMGGSLVSAYRASETPFTPQAARVLLLTIPPDEKMAAGILDLGLRNFLQPFFGVTSYNGRGGALYYGIKEQDLKLEPFLKKAAKILAGKADAMAGAMGVKKGKLVYLGFPALKEGYSVHYKDVKITLPGKICSSDKNIPLSLSFYARYEIAD